ncbi:MAG: glycerophosphodiester phosphodiesterase [Planctomycetota bacterium]|nr:MAG: glycerophosphodiester phosphodiesterase [Planctomycetota bacterium]
MKKETQSSDLHCSSSQSVCALAKDNVDRVFWQAHRGGGSKDAPDNTMAAFLYTWNLGGIPEADIRTTKDGTIICLHDPTLERTAIAPKDILEAGVDTLTFEDIHKRDVGVKFKEEFKGERIPSLEEMFGKMKDDPERQVYLDIKDVDLEVLGQTIKKFAVEKQVLIASSHQSECATLKEIGKSLRAMIWIGGSSGEIRSKFAKVVSSRFAGVDQVQLHLKDREENSSFRYQLDPIFLKKTLQICRDANIDLEVFPFEFDKDSLHALLDIGIRWFATDEPKRFNETLKEWQLR